MRKSVLSLFAFSVALAAQTLTPTVSPTSVVAGKPSTLTLTYAPGATPAAAVQWSFVAPTGGAIGTWTAGAASTAAGKTVTCGSIVCVDYGLNQNVLGAGALASVTVTPPSTARGPLTLTIAAPLSADAQGNALSTTAVTVTLIALSPFDLNGDGKVDAADLIIAVNQVIGLQPCTTADFNGDGVCNVQDLVLLIADSFSANP